MTFIDAYCPTCRRHGDVRFVGYQMDADGRLRYEYRCADQGHLFALVTDDAANRWAR